MWHFMTLALYILKLKKILQENYKKILINLNLPFHTMSVTSSQTLRYIGSYIFNYFSNILDTIKIKLGQILVQLMLFLTRFLLYFEDWKLVPGPFMILIKEQYKMICRFLVNGVHYFWSFQCTPSKECKNYKLIIFDFWLIEVGW